MTHSCYCFAQVRLFGPALLIVWMFRFGLFIPDLLDDPTVIFGKKEMLS